MKLLLVGEVFSRFETEFNDKEKGLVKTKKIQMLETLENGKGVLTEIKLDDKRDLTTLTNGTKIQMEVIYSLMKEKIYWRQNGDIKFSQK